MQALFQEILDRGEDRQDGTRRLFGHSCHFNLQNAAFPTLDPEATRLAFEDIKWLLSGHTDVTRLTKVGLTSYDKKVVQGTDIGPNYGFHWRHFGGTAFSSNPGGCDQVARCLTLLKDNPESRNIVLSMFDPKSTSNQLPNLCYYPAI